MKKLLLILVVFATQFIYAQTTQPTKPTATKPKCGYVLPIVKTNLLYVAGRYFDLQVEQPINKHFSGLLGYSFIPNGGMPFKKSVEKKIDNADAVDRLEKVKFGGSSITPEFRYYPGKKGFGRGFYLSLFYRYSSFKLNNYTLSYSYTDANNVSQNQTLTMNTKFKSNTIGFGIGDQYFIKKHFVIDWYIIGFRYGGSKTDINALSSRTFSTEEQTSIKKELDDIKIPFTTIKSNVTANSATANVSGQWAGLRMGLSFGYKF